MTVAHGPGQSVDIAIVGGGLSGLYCALQLARRIKARATPTPIANSPTDNTASVSSEGPPTTAAAADSRYARGMPGSTKSRTGQSPCST